MCFIVILFINFNKFVFTELCFNIKKKLSRHRIRMVKANYKNNSYSPININLSLLVYYIAVLIFSSTGYG